ncbi:hypothetical protein HC928_24890 [bacterium]|nr:hypothetical protein [bacterium]
MDRAIADKCPVPVILYNVPGRTGTNIQAETLLSLAQHPNIIGVKEASGNITQAMRLVKDKPDDFLLISGDDMLLVPLMAIGAIGVISVLANAFPEVFRNTINHCRAGRYPEASAEALKLFDLNPLMYEEGNPVGIKQVLHELNICSNQVRLPMAEASERHQVNIRRALAELMAHH